MILAPGYTYLSAPALAVTTNLVLLICENIICLGLIKTVRKLRVIVSATAAGLISSIICMCAPSNSLSGYAMGVIPNIWFFPLIVLSRLAVYKVGFKIKLCRSIIIAGMMSLILIAIGYYAWFGVMGVTTVKDPSYVPAPVEVVSF